MKHSIILLFFSVRKIIFLIFPKIKYIDNYIYANDTCTFYQDLYLLLNIIHLYILLEVFLFREHVRMGTSVCFLSNVNLTSNTLYCCPGFPYANKISKTQCKTLALRIDISFLAFTFFLILL